MTQQIVPWWHGILPPPDDPEGDPVGEFWTDDRGHAMAQQQSGWVVEDAIGPSPYPALNHAFTTLGQEQARMVEMIGRMSED